MMDSYESFKAVNDRRYANALALAAEYAAAFLASAVHIAARPNGAPADLAAKIVDKTCGPALAVRPEVISALVVAQAHVFAALSASLDEASLEQALGDASSEISAAVRALDN